MDNNTIFTMDTDENIKPGQYNELILKMNRLRDIYIRAGMRSPPILFPQIVVIGGQSSGKSSVLESFVGRDFLPRGSGTVTRCPLVLNLIQTNIPKESASFEHKGETEFTDFNEIKNEIIKQTSKLNGTNHGISDDPIRLTIRSPNVVNLTLVDLPGVTRVPKGDQPKDIEKITRDMILGFIKDENVIILAVSAANQDLNTSDALMLAKEVDPDGIRTIGVLTKLDIMDKGTDALNEVMGKGLFPLRLGYVPVQNRSQEDIDNGIDIIEARRKEKDFFERSPIYKDMADKFGSTYLQKILNSILTKKIHEKIPDLKHVFEQQYLEYELKQEKFCGFLEERKKFDDMDENDRMNFLRKERAIQISAMSDEFKKEIGGQDFGSIDLDVVSRGALIHEIITNQHSDKLDQIEFNRKDLVKKLQTAIVNARGAYGGIFTPDAAFNEVIKYLIDKFKEPSTDCLNQVTTLLRLIIDECVKKANRYPVLRDSARSVLKSFVGHSMRETQEHLKYTIEIQKSMINNHHVDFHPISNMTDPLKRIQISPLINKDFISNNLSSALKIVSGVAGVAEAAGFAGVAEAAGVAGVAGMAGVVGVAGAAVATMATVAAVVAGVAGDAEDAEAVPASEEFIEENGLSPLSGEFSSRGSSPPSEENLNQDFVGKIEMIESYSKILRKSFKDIVPKVILNSLIDKTKEFFTVELDSELDKKFDLLDIMEINEEERLEVEDFLRKKSVIEQVLAELATF